MENPASVFRKALEEQNETQQHKKQHKGPAPITPPVHHTPQHVGFANDTAMDKLRKKVTIHGQAPHAHHAHGSKTHHNQSEKGNNANSDISESRRRSFNKIKASLTEDSLPSNQIGHKAKNLIKHTGEFDGVNWRNQMKNYFRDSTRRWPPKSMCGFFLSKGYYQDWSEVAQEKSKYFSKYLEDEVSDDELTKIENEIYKRARDARDEGRKHEIEEWESYYSEDSNGKTVKKLRRRSLEKRNPELYRSHAARKLEFAKRLEEKKRQKLNPDYTPEKPDFSPFLGSLKHYLKGSSKTFTSHTKKSVFENVDFEQPIKQSNIVEHAAPKSPKAPRKTHNSTVPHKTLTEATKHKTKK